MSCRRICRELVSQARFGELGPDSARHLEHLTACRGCRDELGFDRALVRQLRTALAQRIDGAAPSPQAWQGVLARMAAAEHRPSRMRAWSTTLVNRLRVGSAMTGATLAFVMALQVEVVPVRPSDAGAESQPQAAAPARPITLADGFPQAAATTPYAPADEPAGDVWVAPVTPVTPGIGAQEPEKLPILGARTQPAAPTPADAPDEESAAAERAAPTVRLVPADAATLGGQDAPDAGETEPATEEPVPDSTPQPSGAPS